jgi:glutathione S-transferase
MRTQGPYLCGDQFTLADMSFMPEMFWLDVRTAAIIIDEQKIISCCRRADVTISSAIVHVYLSGCSVAERDQRGAGVYLNAH